MRQLTVISGKGGTGKTSVTAALAFLAGDVVLADCDVDAPDLHLLTQPQVHRRESFTGGKRAVVIADKCCGCGRCADVCRFDAMTLDGPANGVVGITARVAPMACEGCVACVQVCPANAIHLHDVVNGEWFVSDTRLGPMVHATLYPGHENSGKLVSIVRQEARKTAQSAGRGLILIDGPPGLGCPVIASITGADLVLAVTEPTRSGKHDLERILDLAARLGVEAMVCVNRWDVNEDITREIEDMARGRGAIPAGRIRTSREFVESQMRCLSLVEYSRNGAAEDVAALWARVAAQLGVGTGRREDAR